ncbi:putative G-protein coupled receptor 133, partial [Stegodyphus mimosarum]
MILALKTFNEQMSVTHRTEICKTRNSMRAGITLLPFFAINWFFGILAVEDSYNTSLQLIFALTNSMQGILTFIFFCFMDNNVQMSFRLKMMAITKKPKV